MVAPEVIVVEGLQFFADRDDAGAGGVESHGGDSLALDARVLSASRVASASASIWSSWAWVAKLGVFAATVERVRGRRGADGAFKRCQPA